MKVLASVDPQLNFKVESRSVHIKSQQKRRLNLELQALRQCDFRKLQTICVLFFILCSFNDYLNKFYGSGNMLVVQQVISHKHCFDGDSGLKFST
ncbi:CLUMA_CG018363, isoform A [Clunio marinus]|uniref:CLUMA_CG018363, isoform A n=1 Tax=Clunio marinus TaxID=568069 RepID=A0A1J1J0Q4_9DIPT|nr:CLUMA_CG018363, isoform A [Clunio marinus]